MNDIVETTPQTTPKPQYAIEVAVEEALLVAEFFDLITRDATARPQDLPLGFPTVDFLEAAQSTLDVPVGLDELSALTVSLTKRR